MTVATHCPSVEAGTLLPSAIPVSNISDDVVTIQDPGAGNRRGICVFMHFSLSSNQGLPLPVPNSIGENVQSLFSPMVADGWVCAYPASPQDFSVGNVGYFGNVYHDVEGDPLFGGGLRSTMVHWWTHMVEYLAGKYGPDRPIILGGFSWGSWQVLAIATGATNTLTGYFAHALPTLFENITAFAGYNLALLNWTNMDLPIDTLTNPPMTIPGIIGLCHNDGTVGWSSSSTPVSTTDQMLTLAGIEGVPITRYTSTENGVPYPDGHLFLPQDATTYFDWVQTHMDPLAPPHTF